MIYDLFYISKTTVNLSSWKKFQDRFPTAKLIENVVEFSQIKHKALTKFFWIVWDDLEIVENFNFDYRIPKWDEQYVHVFLNGESYNGVVLIPKALNISNREFEHRFYTSSKQIEIVASHFKPYQKFIIESYDDYLKAVKEATTDMFWVIPKEVEIIDFNFDLRISYSDSYNKKINHVFQHQFNNDLTYNGIFLTNRNLTLTKKEIEYRSPVSRKEYQILASKMRPYDIVFISYNEANADENYQRLLKRFPRAKRVHGIKGIHQAHIEAARIVDTDMFWAVDADAVILDDFNFDYEASRYDRHTVHVWSSQNPINDLIYGYGGVKLLPTTMTLNLDVNSTDMTTSISSDFKAMPDISNITAFNTDPFSTWKSAFRECVKLASKVIDRQESTETEHRLEIWATEGRNKLYGEYAIQGAKDGREYGYKYKTDLDQLKNINNFDWLHEYFENRNKIKTDI